MNAKMLLTPLLIVIIIAALIWFVYPAFSNGTDGVKEKYEKLKKEEAKYEGLKNKNQHVEKIFSEISSLGADKDVLYKFIPEKIKEEEMVDNLNYLASSSGISISQISINQSAIQSTAKPVVADGESVDNLNSFRTSPQNIKASVILAGNYEKIKSFFEKLDKLERFSNFSKLEISKIPAAGENEAAPDILSVKTDIDFNYLEKAKLSDANASDPIFSPDSKLNLDIISEIKDKKTTDILNLDAGQKGKANPFMP